MSTADHYDGMAKALTLVARWIEQGEKLEPAELRRLAEFARTEADRWRS